MVSGQWSVVSGQLVSASRTIYRKRRKQLISVTLTQNLRARTAAPIPKSMIFDCLAELRKVSVKAPVHIGDVVLADVCGTGVDAVAAGNIG